MLPYTLRLDCQKWRPEVNKPIKVIFTQAGRPTAATTGYSVKSDQWDDQRAEVVNHRSAEAINEAIYAALGKYIKKAAQLELLGMPVTKEILSQTKKVGLEEFAKKTRGDNAITTQQLNRIKEYYGRFPMLHEITIEWWDKYMIHMKEVKNYGSETIFCVYKFIRRLLNAAFKDKMIAVHPFHSATFKAPPEGESKTIYLTDEELGLYLDYEKKHPNKKSQQYADLVYFLIACHVGYRHSDWDKIGKHNPPYKGAGGKWFFRVRAKKNGADVVVPIGETVLYLYSIAKDLKPSKTTAEANANIRAVTDVVGVEKDVTSHIGRHTCGFKCASDGMSRETVAAVLAVSLRAVKVYYHVTGHTITEHAGSMAKW